MHPQQRGLVQVMITLDRRTGELGVRGYPANEDVICHLVEAASRMLRDRRKLVLGPLRAGFGKSG